MTTTTYNFHQDPGHGWIEVPMAEIKRLAIADKISGYSYRKDDIAFLEEDCDAAVFVLAKTARGEAFAFRDVHTNRDSFIRNLNRFGG